MTQRVLALGAIILTASIFAGPAFASSPATTSLGVSANAVAVCSLSTTAVAFGNLSTTAATDATGSITVTCTNGDALTIALDAGGNASGTQRRLVNSGNYLNYNLYQPTAAGNAEASPTVAWGDGTALGSTYTATANGTAQTFNVYGEVPSGQSLYVGGYSDTVTVTLTY